MDGSPYLKKELPKNPFNDLNTVTIDKVMTDVDNATDDSASGWKFYTLTGRLLANDGAHGRY